MTTYYVSKNGSDANNGLGPDASHATNKPWLTIGKALGASGVPGGAAGHRLEIGPGVYRETIAPALTAPTVEIVVHGDPSNSSGFKDGSGVLVTGGEIRVTAYTTNETSAPSTNAVLDCNAKNFLTFENITWCGGNAFYAIDFNGAHHITLRNCVIFPRTTLSGSAVKIPSFGAVDGGIVIERCSAIGGDESCISVFLPRAGADYDANIQIRRCKFQNTNPSYGAIAVFSTGAGAGKPGGVDMVNSFVYGGGRAFMINDANLSTLIPCTAYNNVLITGNATALQANTSGQLLSDYNDIKGVSYYNNVSAGANDRASVNYSLLIDIGQSEMYGALPVSFGTPVSGSPQLGVGGTSPSATDFLGRISPAGGASTSAALGALERHDSWVKETSTVRTGTNALSCTGPGDQDFYFAVDVVSTTLSVWMRYDTTHATTNKPQALLLNGGECGVADQTATMTTAVDTWEQLSFTFTPTAKGIVTMRLVSRSAAGGGKAFADDFGQV
jgi:hypothetical protein